MLKPQDILTILKLIRLPSQKPSYQFLASELCMSKSEIHAAVKRLHASKLLHQDWRINTTFLAKVLETMPFFFYAKVGKVDYGFPTAWHYGLTDDIRTSLNELPHIWANPHGTVRGHSLEPLTKKAPEAAQKDASLYQLLAWIDCLRVGKVRERELALEKIQQILHQYDETFSA